MIAVGIETSGKEGSVAVVRDSECLDERPLSRTGRRHASTLVLELRQLLQSARIAPEQLDVVAVSIGPGSFTGLRVGVVCAKTLAYATRATLIGVDTFEAVARNAPPDVVRQFVIGDAQRGDVFVGRYHRSDSGWERNGDIGIVPFQRWRNELPAEAVVSGPGVQVFSAEFPGSTRLLDAECLTPAASHVAAVGRQRAVRGFSDDPCLLEPLYLRKSGAEEKALTAGTRRSVNASAGTDRR
jgi:tRNA threonylcarbamoyladenosine biosynthesis protein TsaB